MNAIFIQKIPATDYTLLSKPNRYSSTGLEYIVAYGYDPESKTWGQGHYFETLEEVLSYLNNWATEYSPRDVFIDSRSYGVEAFPLVGVEDYDPWYIYGGTLHEALSAYYPKKEDIRQTTPAERMQAFLDYYGHGLDIDLLIEYMTRAGYTVTE